MAAYRTSHLSRFTTGNRGFATRPLQIPDVTFSQLENALAEENGVTVPELRQRLRRLEKVFREAKSDVLEARRMKAKLMRTVKGE